MPFNVPCANQFDKQRQTTREKVTGSPKTQMSLNSEATKLITIKQAADTLAFKPHTLYTLIREGIVPAVKIGRSIRIRVTDLNAMIESNRTFSRKDALA